MKLLILTAMLVCTISFIECKSTSKCTDLTGWENYKKKFNVEPVSVESDIASCEIYEMNMKKLENRKKQRKGD
jgi:hypothetical protein